MTDPAAPLSRAMEHRLAEQGARIAARRHIPWHMRFPGPVFNKEVWILGKRPSTAWLRLLFVAVLLFIVGIVFASMQRMSSTGSAAQLQQYQELAPAITMAIVWVEFIMLVLIAIALGGPAVCDEKRMGTLGTLLTTPLQTWQIVLGKGLGRLVELFILALVPLPLMLAVRSFGGVTAEAIATMTVTCLVNGLLAVQIAMLFSTISKRATSAIIAALVGTAGVFFLPLLCIVMYSVIVTAGRPGNPMGNAWSLVTCAPIVLSVQAYTYLFGDSMSIPLPLPIRQVWLYHVLYTLCLWLGFFWLTCVALRRAMTLENRGASISTKKAGAAPAAIDAAPQSPDAAGVPGVPKRRSRGRRAPEGSSRVVGDAPVMWRELQQTIFRGRAAGIIAWVAIGAVMLFIYYMAAFEEPVQQVMAAIGAVVMLLGCAVISTGALSQERESRTLEALLCTPLSAWDIVWGKFLGSARRAGFGLMLIMAHIIVSGFCSKPLGPLVRLIDQFFPATWSNRSVNPTSLDPVALLLTPLILAGPMAFLLAMGVFFSARFKKSTSATVCNMGLALGLWAVLPMTTFMLTEALMTYDNGIVWLAQNTVIAINPTPMVTIAVNGCVQDSTPLTFDMPKGNWGIGGFFVAHAVICVAYLGGAWLALKGAAATLAKPTGRLR